MNTKLSSNYLLYLVCLCGFSILVLEFAAVSYLEPYIGKNTIIWSNIIALVMISLCIGYFLGGRLVNQHKKHKLVLTIIGISGLYLLCLPWFAKPFITIYFNIMSLIIDHHLVGYIGSFLLTAILLGPPLLSLAIIEPYIITLYSTESNKIGSQAGHIFSLATLGGLVGLYTTSLFLIPTVGSKPTIIIIGTCLLISATKPILASFKLLFLCISCVVLIVISTQQSITSPRHFHSNLEHKNNLKSFFQYEGEVPQILYEKETMYQFLQIGETTTKRWLLLGGSGKYYQSVYQKNGILTGRYCDYYTALPNYLSSEKKPDILLIGLAGGSISRLLHHYYPNSSIDGIEIDPAVINASKKYFNLEKQTNLTIFNEDGRQFLNHTTKKYDIIILDVFSQEYYIPSHLSSKEFFTLIYNHLNTDGLLSINVVITPTNEIKKTIENTLTTVFPNVYNHDNQTRSLQKNIIATIKPLEKMEKKLHKDPLINIFTNHVGTTTRVIHNPNKIVLTDDKNPIEFLMNKFVWSQIISK